MKLWISLGLLGVIAAVAGAATALWLNQGARHAADELRPAFSLPDLAGNTRHVDEWDGKLLLINFWATWCKPCRKEIPLLIDAQKQHADAGLQVLGLALDDIEPVRGYAGEMSINYPVMVDAMAVAKLQDAYNGGAALPYSVLVDRSGRIVKTHRGELEAEQLQQWLEQHL